jgi:predicted O-methyltransferase YrrM
MNVKYFNSYITQSEADALVKYVKNIDKGFIVEIGTYAGGTTALMADNSSATIVTIDNYILNTNPLDVYNLLKEYNNIIVIVGNSIIVSKLWINSIELLFIDASHVYIDVKKDFESWSPYLTEDSILVFHDACPHKEICFRALNGGEVVAQQGPMDVVNELINSNWKIIDIVDTLVFLKRM